MTLGLSAGAVWTALLLPWPEVTAALAAAVAAANVWVLFAGLDPRLLVLAQLRTSWETLRIEYGALWLGRAVLTVAMLGGYLNRKHDLPPGHQIVWEGYTRLATIAESYGRLRRLGSASYLFQEPPESTQ